MKQIRGKGDSSRISNALAPRSASRQSAVNLLRSVQVALGRYEKAKTISIASLKQSKNPDTRFLLFTNITEIERMRHLKEPYSVSLSQLACSSQFSFTASSIFITAVPESPIASAITTKPKALPQKPLYVAKRLRIPASRPTANVSRIW